ncbi:hypothetical protein GCM10009821_20090 [Aeromicrobium halocynthiae]|uniref:GIY-YIG nuclease family protein n=1 Tax=Aeromicrobium halocynthiae TaxID=560557 RepID=A0ABN2W181_9ACTN
MLIGAYGIGCDLGVYEWNRVAGRRLLGWSAGRGDARSLADFSAGRGVYALYQDNALYYVGKTLGYGRFTGRSSDHAKASKSRHHANWNSFSWFSFDQPMDQPGADGIHALDGTWNQYDLYVEEAVGGLEAILSSASCRRQEMFAWRSTA